MKFLNATTEQLTKSIEVWFERAAMAYKQNNIELSSQALERRWQYQKDLAELEGKEPPGGPKEPEDYFGRQENFNPPGGGSESIRRMQFQIQEK